MLSAKNSTIYIFEFKGGDTITRQLPLGVTPRGLRLHGTRPIACYVFGPFDNFFEYRLVQIMHPKYANCIYYYDELISLEEAKLRHLIGA